MESPSLNLRQAHAHLVRTLGAAAPSTATLKRHASKGLLLGAATRLGKRPLYDGDKLVSHYRIATPPPHDLGQGAALPSSTAITIPKDIESVLATVVAAVNQLLGVQQALMRKYDQAYALAIARAEHAEQERDALKRSSFEIEKITQNLSRLREDVRSLRPPQ
jgi:hypothetical protein